jgi:hypothetical protein
LNEKGFQGTLSDDPACAGCETLGVLGIAGGMGTYNVLALTSSGNPVVAYYNAVPPVNPYGELKVITCIDLIRPVLRRKSTFAKDQ